MNKVIFSVMAATTLLTGSFTFALLRAEANGADTEEDIASTDIAKFKDVENHWAQDVIAKAYDRKMISGYEDGTFKPNGQITRAEFAAILSRSTKLPSATGSDPFSDMKGHWAESAVIQLVAQGFINPGDYPSGFNPNTQLTRYEMIKWISNGLMKSNDSFEQAFEDTQNTLLPTPEAIRGEISVDEVPYIALVRGTGIVGGFADGTLKPKSTTTRAEVAAILLRYMDVEGENADIYPDLKELREVGLTGANLVSNSNYRYMDGNFSNLINTQITLSNKSAIMKIKRFIVVDATSGQLKGAYASLFNPAVQDYQKGNYITYAELSFMSLLDVPNILTFSQGNKSRLVQFYRIADENYVNSVGLETLPSALNDYLKTGVERTFWTTSTLKGEKGGYILKNDNGSGVTISNS
ncbi:S-layer homology domain-containing protein [Paenibacillus hamazuiensis]|uniref:S-layer homology domain-containing protein n=1 Tax=Paenibacillus hamazuiensis TaxID=2936508 RepID=UPI00200F92C2|nr:S-layer homology domain-containing protein [Paenibacillus hamazuiensis]